MVNYFKIRLFILFALSLSPNLITKGSENKTPNSLRPRPLRIQAGILALLAKICNPEGIYLL